MGVGVKGMKMVGWMWVFVSTRGWDGNIPYLGRGVCVTKGVRACYIYEVSLAVAEYAHRM